MCVLRWVSTVACRRTPHSGLQLMTVAPPRAVRRPPGDLHDDGNARDGSAALKRCVALLWGAGRPLPHGGQAAWLSYIQAFPP